MSHYHCKVDRMGRDKMTHYMNLWDDSFQAIKEGWKTIEMRLNDEKRSMIKVDDIIEFTNTSTQEKLSSKVKTSISIHISPNCMRTMTNNPLDTWKMKKRIQTICSSITQKSRLKSTVLWELN